MKTPKFTPQWAEKIAFEYVEKFCLCFLLPDGLHSTYEFNDKSFHVIFIYAVIQGDTKQENNQLETFIHELIHVFHSVWNLPQNEKCVDKKAKRFCRQHEDFARALFDSIITSSKCEGQNGVNNPFDRSEGIGIIAKKIEKELRKKAGRS